MTHSPDHAERAADVESAIRIALWNACKAHGMSQDGSIQLVAQTLADPVLAAALRGRDAVVDLQAEILRLRGLLIDPGNPAWEDARAVLVAELRKAEMPNHARAVADGAGAYIPSWMALNLIAHATRAALHDAAHLQQNGEGVER